MELAIKSKKFRVVDCSVEVEGMIPFQETVQTGGNVTVATASNRPNIWYYKDSTELLPKLNGAPNTLWHSDLFQTPYGNYTRTLLKHPTFTLNNMSFTASSHKLGPAITATLPQTWFSLMGTGRVKTVYPGQKIKEHWKNPIKTWQYTRLPWDNPNLTTANGATALAYQQSRNQILGPQVTNHIGDRTDGSAVAAGTPTSATILNHYADTHLALKEGGPPYLLVKVEPYYDTQDNALAIYMQAHIHYSMTLEYECNEHFNTIAPYNFTGMRPANSEETFNDNWRDATAQFGAGNELNMRYGPQQGNYLYS